MGLVKKYVYPTQLSHIWTSIVVQLPPARCGARVPRYRRVWNVSRNILSVSFARPTSTTSSTLSHTLSTRPLQRLSLWYPKHMLQWRFGLFWGGATCSGAFSGLIAYGISFMSGTDGLLGWSWIFVRVLLYSSPPRCSIIHYVSYQIIEGLATVAVAVLAFFGKCIQSTTLQRIRQRTFHSIRRSSRHRNFPHAKRTHFPAQSTEYASCHCISSYLLINTLINLAGSDYSGGGEEEKFDLREVPRAMLDWKIIVAAITDVTISMPRRFASLAFSLELVR